MKTAMQELIELLEETKKTKCTKLHELVFFDGVLSLIDSGKFIEKEKRQIIDSYNQGYRDGELDTISLDNTNDISEYSNAEQYYNETFKQ